MNSQATKSRPSRWDALKSEPSTSPSSSRHRLGPRERLPNNETTSTSTPSNKTIHGHGGYGNCQYKGKQSSGSMPYRPGNSAGGSWRRRVANNTGNNVVVTPARTTDEEGKVKEAIKSLQNCIQMHILDTNKGGHDDGPNSSDHRAVLLSIEQLSATLFDVSDTTTNIISQQPLYFFPEHKHSAKVLPNISSDVIWEASYSLIHNIQLLSHPPKQSRGVDCIQLMHKISTVVLPCLQSLIHNQHQLVQQKQKQKQQQCTRIKTMTDLRLCECATILLDASNKCTVFDGNDDDTTNNTADILLLCKATLYSCLSKVITISTLFFNATSSVSSANDAHNAKTKQQGMPLFPWGAEKTVNLVVKQSVLPFIELLTDDEANNAATPGLSVPMKMRFCHGAMECLYLLLKDPNWDAKSLESIGEQKPQMSKHAAAILAPLVVDVLHDGKEKQRVNPLRLRALTAISAYWGWSVECIQSKEAQLSASTNAEHMMLMPCQCLAAALNALSVLRKGKAQTNQHTNSHELNVSSIARQLQSMMQDNEFQRLLPKPLNLLVLLGTAYPNASASQWHLFLEQSGAKPSPLVSILEGGASALSNEKFGDKSLSALCIALRATSTLVSAMPLSLWISREARPSIRLTGGNFSSRVRNALLNVIKCTAGLMLVVKDKMAGGGLSKKGVAQSMESVMLQVSQLGAKLCTALPFNGENSVLLQPASHLIQCAADIYGVSVKAIANEPLMPEVEMKNSFIFKAMINSSYIITESLGVCSTGSANPAENWLSDASSYGFVGILLTDSYWKYHITKERVDMLSSVAKKSTWTLAREPFNLAAFCGVCAAQCKSQLDPESRVLGGKLIESFILGRLNCSLENDSDGIVFTAVIESLCPLLLAALKDSSPGVRSCAASSLGSLLQGDWYNLLGQASHSGRKGEHSIDWTTMESLLTLCSVDHEKSANVRASACKAIGDTCTTCIVCPTYGDALPDVFIFEFTAMICKVMDRAVSDQNASVRSMALFAVGNIALSLKDLHNVRHDIDIPINAVTLLFPSVRTCLSDKDEKVVANAIRTISHIAFFVYHSDFATEVKDRTWQPLDLYRSLISDLSGRIKFALDDAAGGLSQELTWKQRNGAKKHAWGSCTTLGTLLSFSNLLQFIDDNPLLDLTISNLFQCIQLSSIVNEKIVAAASKALESLPTVFWQHLSGKCDSIGRGLAICFGFLEKKTIAPYHTDVETLANLLLACAQKSDFCALFLIQEKVPFSIEYFYQWTVTHDVEAGILEEVAAAVSSQEVEQILDVSIAQRFLSRTIQQNRRQGSPCKVNVASLRLDEDDDEGDEL